MSPHNCLLNEIKKINKDTVDLASKMNVNPMNVYQML